MILKPRPFRKPRGGHWATKSLVGLWLFNEGSGKKVYDLSGNGYNGTATGLATRITTIFGSGFDFDGVGGAGEIEIDMQGHDPFGGKYLTIIAYINWNQDNDSTPRIIDRQYNKQFAFCLVDAGDKLSWALCTAGGNVDRGSASVLIIPKNKWVQVALTYDGVSANTYLDGLLGESISAGLGGVINSSTDNMVIGERVDGSGRLFDGQIDNVMIYNRALSASEISLLYREPFCMFERDPIELWSAATLGAPQVGMAGAMTTNTGYWGW